MEALRATGREDLIGYGKECLIRPNRGQNYAKPQTAEEKPTKKGTKPEVRADRKADSRSGKKPPAHRGDGRHSVERSSGAANGKRKAGWAKPKAKKQGKK